MKHMFKVGVAALALTMVAPAFAENSVERRGAVGCTPIAIGLATPLQLPWGIDRWDVFGLDLNVFYSDAPKAYGLDIGGLAAVVRDEMEGWQISGLLNYNIGDVYGLRTTLGANICRGTVYGCDLGLLAFRDSIVGFDAEFLGSAQNEMHGVQIGGLANVCGTKSYGVSIAGLTNVAKAAHGMQIALGFNMTEELHGGQIALVNFAELCPNGFQIGLVNIIVQNTIPVLPFVNCYF